MNTFVIFQMGINVLLVLANGIQFIINRNNSRMMKVVVLCIQKQFELRGQRFEPLKDHLNRVYQDETIRKR